MLSANLDDDRGEQRKKIGILQFCFKIQERHNWRLVGTVKYVVKFQKFPYLPSTWKNSLPRKWSYEIPVEPSDPATSGPRAFWSLFGPFFSSNNFNKLFISTGTYVGYRTTDLFIRRNTRYGLAAWKVVHPVSNEVHNDTMVCYEVENCWPSDIRIPGWCSALSKWRGILKSRSQTNCDWWRS